MLEKSRVVYQAKGERNFHILYYLLGGLSPDEKQEYDLQDAASYRYSVLLLSACDAVDILLVVRCVSESGTPLDFINNQDMWSKLDEVRTSLHAIGFTNEVDSCYSV